MDNCKCWVGVLFLAILLLQAVSTDAKSQKSKQSNGGLNVGGLNIDNIEEWAKVFGKNYWNVTVEYGRSIGLGYKDKKYASLSDSEKINEIIKFFCLRNAVFGFATGLPGWLGLPAGLLSSLAIQVALVSAVATVKGLDVASPSVIFLMAGVLGGDVATESLKVYMKAVGATTIKQFLRSATGKVIEKAINRVILDTVVFLLKSVGMKYAWQRLVGIIGAVPVIGAVVGFGVDGVMCYTIAHSLNWAVFDVSESS